MVYVSWCGVETILVEKIRREVRVTKMVSNGDDRNNPFGEGTVIPAASKVVIRRGFEATF